MNQTNTLCSIRPNNAVPLLGLQLVTSEPGYVNSSLFLLETANNSDTSSDLIQSRTFGSNVEDIAEHSLKMKT